MKQFLLHFYFKNIRKSLKIIRFYVTNFELFFEYTGIFSILSTPLSRKILSMESRLKELLFIKKADFIHKKF